MENLIFHPRGAMLLAEANELAEVASGYFFTEGPVWDSTLKRLYFTDFNDNAIYAMDEPGKPRLYRRDSGRAVGLSLTRNGTVVSAETSSHAVCLAGPNRSEPVADSYQGSPFNSPNDVVVSADGSVYFTDPWSKAMGGPHCQPCNGIYRVPRLADGYGEPVQLWVMERPNGLAFSPDESILYINDTNRNLIEAFQTRANGTVSRIGVFASLDPSYGPGAADGMKVDDEGNVYVTGPAGLWIFDAAGDALALLRTPKYVGNFCFGGADRRDLYIAASDSVYRTRMGIPGIIPYRDAKKEQP